MPMTNYLKDALLNDVFGDAAYAVPATLYVALSTTTPTDAGANFTEPVGNGYARVAMTNNTTNFPNATTTTNALMQLKQNGTAITFPQDATAAWGTVTVWGIFDAASAGNLLYFGFLTAPQTDTANGSGATGQTITTSVAMIDANHADRLLVQVGGVTKVLETDYTYQVNAAGTVTIVSVTAFASGTGNVSLAYDKALSQPIGVNNTPSFAANSLSLYID